MRRILVLALAVSALSIHIGAQSPLSNKKFINGLIGLNAMNVSSFVYSGTGTMAGAGDKSVPLTRYSVAVNYGLGARKVEREGTARPKRLQQFMNEGFAWSVADRGKPVPAPQMVAEARRQIWMTPHGVFKAAQEPDAKTLIADQPGTGGAAVTTITYTAAGSRIKASLNAAGLVERVETMPGDPVLGNQVVEISYSDYKDFGGIKFPTHIAQKQGGRPVLDVTITDLTPNAGFYVDVPESVQKAGTATK